MDVMRALDAAGIDAVDLNRRAGHPRRRVPHPDRLARAPTRGGRRMTTVTDVRRSSAAPRAARRPPAPRAVARDVVERHAGVRRPQHRAHPPDPREAARRHAAAADVRAAVRVRVRRRDRRSKRRQLPRVPHRRHPRAVAGVRADRPGDRDRHRPHRGRDRPLPVAAGDAHARTSRVTTSPSSPGMALSIVVLLGAGLIVGWRVHTDVAPRRTGACCCCLRSRRR